MTLILLLSLSVKSAAKKAIFIGGLVSWFFVSTLLGKTDVSVAAIPVIFPLFLVLLAPIDLMGSSASMQTGGWSYLLSLGRGRMWAFWISFLVSCGYSLVLVLLFSLAALAIDYSYFPYFLLSWTLTIGYMLALAAIIFGTSAGNAIWVRAALLLTPILILRNRGGMPDLSAEVPMKSEILVIAVSLLIVEAALFAFGLFKLSRRSFR